MILTATCFFFIIIFLPSPNLFNHYSCNTVQIIQAYPLLIPDHNKVSAIVSVICILLFLPLYDFTILKYNSDHILFLSRAMSHIDRGRSYSPSESFSSILALSSICVLIFRAKGSRNEGTATPMSLTFSSILIISLHIIQMATIHATKNDAGDS